MSEILIILGIIIFLIFLIVMCAFIIAAHMYFCENECPHHQDCLKHEKDKGFVPPCHRERMMPFRDKDMLGF